MPVPPSIRPSPRPPNKLAPLFSMYSSGRLDYFYTTVPQMARAAALGTLKPSNFVLSPSTISYASVGTGITGYGSFPGALQTTIPKAQVWLFTTPENSQERVHSDWCPSTG